jgi:hypothetical protein
MTRAASLVALALAVGACEEGLTDLNVNPNQPTDVGAQYLLPQAIRGAVENTFDSWMMFHHTSIWAQQTVQIQYPDEETGQVRPGVIQGFWDAYYAGSLQDIQVVIDKGIELEKPNHQGVGRIVRAWIFHFATDLWGDIPYSEALKAKEDETTPAYDMQQSIYAGLLDELEAGAAMIGTGSDFAGGDILYGNDFGKWKKFANSLRMRLAMRMSEVDAATAKAEFTAALNAGPFTSNDDNAMLEWPGTPYRNPIFENWQGRDDDGVSATMIDMLKSMNDPRLALYAEPAAQDGEYRGLGNNIASPPLSLAWYSRIGNFWRADGGATPTPLMTYSEVLFLRAEAAARGWISGSPEALMKDAIEANMTQWNAWGPANGPTTAEIAAYIDGLVYTGINDIHTQKWISLYMNGTEAFANQRRVDVPVLTAGPDLAVSRIPVRYNYPDLEQSLNNESLQAAVSRQGGGLDLITPVWWDVN